MNARIDLACAVCGEEFVIPGETYVDHSQVVRCPCCGSTDLAPIVFDEGVMLSCRVIAA
jgi:DNA-directed RNA polymerase subunit RPC12/RpoP